MHGEPGGQAQEEEEEDGADEGPGHQVEPELGGEVEGDDAGEDHGGDAEDDVLQEGDRQPGQHQAGGAGQGADQQELGKRGKNP